MKQIVFIIALFMVNVNHGLAQKAYADAKNEYMVIDATGLPAGCYTDKRTEGFLIVGSRLKRHESNKFGGVSNPSRIGPNYRVAKKFRVSPTDVAENGTTDATEVAKGGTWASFSGWHVNANATPYNVDFTTAPTGCSQYRGKFNNDTPGTWRLPTQKELVLISIFSATLEAGTSTGFVPFSKGAKINYISGTEVYSKITYPSLVESFMVFAISWDTRMPYYHNTFPNKALNIKEEGGVQTFESNPNFRVRCIQDIE